LNGILRKLKVTGLSLLVFLLISCQTGTGPMDREIDPGMIDINDIIESDDPLLAAVYMKKTKNTDNSDWQKLNTTVLAMFDSAVEEKDFSRAVTLFDSVVTLDETVENIGQWTRNRLLLEKAGQFRSEMKSAAAFAIISRLDKAWVGSQLEEDYINKSMKNEKIFSSLYDGKTLDHASELLKTVATIWVNRGIKIENGYGIPDRIIGSGFFIDKSGYLITNYHVIESLVDPEYEGFARLYIKMSNSKIDRIPAKVIGYDPIFDLALLKTEVEPEVVLSLAYEESLDLGRKVLAVGSPAGLENTITSGIISAPGRRFLELGDVLQVDVPINSGNSGGPLLGENGKVLGVVFAGIESFEGINFVIPVEYLNTLLPRLYEKGRVVHNWLGMALNVKDDSLEIIYIFPDGPADKAGLETGDKILTVNGREFTEIVKVQNFLLKYDPGTLYELNYSRENDSFPAYVLSEARPEKILKEAIRLDARFNLFPVLFGFDLIPGGISFFNRFYKVENVIKGSIADETGFSLGDTLIISRWKVDDEKDIAFLQVRVKEKKAGFVESDIQLATFLSANSFI